MHQLFGYQPFDISHLEYQRYYQYGFYQLLGMNKIHLKPFPMVLIDIIKKRYTRHLAKTLSQAILKFSPTLFEYQKRHQPYVGQYRLSLPGQQEIKFAIDAHDHPDICSPAILDWGNIYFKSNYWPSYSYPEKVHPLVNGNGILTPSSIKKLITLRNAPKEIDLVFISRVWGGNEHNIRLFEQLAQISCNKKLLAIFPKPAQPEHIPLQERLNACNVQWSYQLMPYQSLWKQLAHSKLVILRAGKHLCIPWRMVDLLAMGACIIYDTHPRPSWPHPLKTEENFISLNISRTLDDSIMDSDDYTHISSTIHNVLNQPEIQAEIRHNNAKYFDLQASPIKVAEYIVHKASKTL